MLFNSLSYFIFLPLVVGVYFLLSHRYRWIVLLSASYLFYGFWRVEYLGLILFSTAVDYLVALRMAEIKQKRDRKRLLWLSLVTNLGLLLTFKYLGFAFDSINQLLEPLQWGELPVMDLLLPVGISFYTFQTLSYTLDVYHDRIPPEKHLGRFALYVSFFPQLVAGPIERAGNLLPQFKIVQRFSYEQVVKGGRRVLIGLFKKVVIADFLARYVDLVYGHPEDFQGGTVILASIFFAFQIYCDFSGYTDMAIGSAQILGINLGENFRTPYFATSLGDFWRRWHISLSTWFRDYVYLPLGGRRGWFAVLTVFLLSGLWHGANWTFLIWGGVHGLALLGETLLNPKKTLSRNDQENRQKGKWWRIPVTFSIVTLLWVIFRAESLDQAGAIYTKMFTFQGWNLADLDAMGTRLDLFISLALVIGLVLVESIHPRLHIADRMAKWPRWGRWATYYSMIFTLLLMGINSQKPFMYFQF